MEPAERDLVKVIIPLLGSATKTGFEGESVWAEALGGDRYMIWNVPVFAYNIEMRAIVACQRGQNGGIPIVTAVLQQGDCLGIRVYFDATATDEQIARVLDLFSPRDALMEKYSREIWAFGLRTADDYAWAGPALEPFVQAGLLTFESNFQPDEPTYDGRFV